MLKKKTFKIFLKSVERSVKDADKEVARILGERNKLGGRRERGGAPSMLGDNYGPTYISDDEAERFGRRIDKATEKCCNEIEVLVDKLKRGSILTY